MGNRLIINKIYELLAKQYNNDNWWKADSVDEVIIGAILTQNTNWKNVEKAIAVLKEKGLCSLAGITKTKEEDLAEYIKASGFFKVKAKRLKAVADSLYMINLDKYDNEELRAFLLSIHGIGNETADTIMLYGYNLPSFVIDAYTMRIYSRIGIINKKDKYNQVRQLFMDNISKDIELYKKYHALIVTNAKEACKVKPLCTKCPLKALCKFGSDYENIDSKSK
ncbi:MAG TPA: endonuclease [Candidatus Cloacimonadota bacterium]|nr:endonuclease [Candidatus Cloacimonadota bacterium]HQB40683.1 endonuclease [Candidatus Cloacimonadota bacterium]